MLEEGQTCEGHAKHDMGECRMDMVESELGYLGYWNTESYGITWKVTGNDYWHRYAEGKPLLSLEADGF